MSQAQDFVNTFMDSLSGATLNETLKGVFANILAKQVTVEADGSVTLGSSFSVLSKIFTFIATPVDNRPAGPLEYTDEQVAAATTAANDVVAPVEGETFTLTAGAESVDEGSTATFTLATTNVAAGTVVSYTISGVDAADVDGGSLTGSATVGADGTAKISVGLAADSSTEGAETLKVAIDGQSTSASITVNDTSVEDDFSLTTSADNPAMTTDSDVFSGQITSQGTTTTFNSTDNIIDVTPTDNDVFNLTVSDDVAATATGLVRGVETVNVNVDAITTAAATSTELEFDGNNFTGVKNFEFDSVNTNSAINTLDINNINDNGVTVTASSDFATVEVDGKAGSDINVVAQATGSTGAPVTVTVGTSDKSVDISGAGYLNATANAATGLLKATADQNLTVSGTAATVINATSTNGNVTISDATASVNTTANAKGAVSIDKLDAAGSVTVTAGSTISLDATTTIKSTSLNLSGTGASSLVVAADAATVATLSGNGAAVTYDFTEGASTLADVVVTGDQDVTLKIIEGAAGGLNIADNATAGTFTLEHTADADLNLSGSTSLVDNFKVSGTITSDKTIAVKSGQEINFAADQTGVTVDVGTDAGAASQAVIVKLDDGVKDGNAVDLTKLTVTDAKTVTINANTDTTVAGSAVTNTIATLVASDANSNVAINMGVNNLVLGANATTSTVGTGTITVTGSGTLTDAATVTQLTAATLDASAVTGKVTLDSTTALAVGTIKTGSAADTVVLTEQADVTVEMGAGNDKLTLDAASTADLVTSIDLGEGTDTLVFQDGFKLLKGTGSLTVAGVENLVFTNVAYNATATEAVQASVLNGATYNFGASAANATTNVAVTVDSADTTVDLSQLVGSVDAATAVAGMTFTTDASAASAAVAITGVKGAKNSITGSTNQGDTLTGGDLSDTFNITSDASLFNASGEMLDTIAGGAQATNGADTLLVGTNGTAFTIADTDVWSKLSGVESITTVANTAVITIDLDVSAQTAGLTKVDLSGDTDNTGDNVITVDEFTGATTLIGSAGKDTITGGSGADTITITAGADVIASGAGDDVIVITTDAALFNASNALINGSIAGGDGSDTLQIGVTTTGNATAFAIAADDAWTNVTGIETIKSVADEAEQTLNFDSTVWAAGVRTVDISAAKKATGNIIDVSEVDNTLVATTATGMTLKGSATGVTTITGTNGIDTISGGSADDIFDGGAGNDVIDLSAGGTDKVTLTAGNGKDTIAGFQTGANTTVGYDTIATTGGTDLVDAVAVDADDIKVEVGKVTEFNLILSGTGLANDTSGTALLAALATAGNGGTALTLTASAADTGSLVAYQANNAYIYSYDAGVDTDIAASEIELVGVLENVSAGSLHTHNFVA